MRKIKWLRVLTDNDCYVDIMDLDHFCLIKNTIWDNEKDVQVSSCMIKVRISELSPDLCQIIETDRRKEE